MKRIVIKLSSPSEENLFHERVRVTTPDRATPMKELNLGNGEFKIADEEHRAVSPTKIDNHPAKIQTTGRRVLTTEEKNNEVNDLRNAENTPVISNEIALSSPLKTYCQNCGEVVELNELESELNATRKELEVKKLEIEEIKTKLEDELFERLGIEDEFSSERELHEREIENLRERNEELQGEAVWKIEDLENNFKELTAKHENAKEEIGHLKVMLERTVAENIKLRNNESVTDDRVMDILDELEMWKRKAQENAVRRDTSRSILEDETESYENEIKELNEKLMEMGKSNEELSLRVSELENETCDCRKRFNRGKSCELDDSLNSDTIRSKIKTNEILNLENEKQILDLSSELNEVYREHISFQERFSALQELLTAKEKELEDVRNDYESQNIEIQNYKEKNAELKDVILATCQDNAHLKNRLEQQSRDYTQLKKKFIVLETETVWLRDALKIVRTSTSTQIL